MARTVPLSNAKIKETQEIKSNPALMQEIRKGLKAIQRGRGKKYGSIEELFKSSAPGKSSTRKRRWN